MMLGPLLQYQSLKTVLLHTDANTRFRISTHISSVRDVEKRIPLKMSSLDISQDWRTIVNDAQYEVGIIRHFPDGNAPPPVAWGPRLRGADSDFDEFGFPFNAGSNVVLPGDVSFQWGNLPEFRRDREDEERRHRDQLRRYEKIVEVQAESKLKGITVEDYLKSLGPIRRDRLERELGGVREFLTISPEIVSYSIEYYKLQLLPFDCRRNNTKTPFTSFVQLTITKGDIRQIHRFEYSKKLFEASKSFHEALFGRRAMPIQVGRLVMNGYDTIHRLPIGFRLNAKHVHTTQYNLAHASFRSIVASSERLETVGLRFSMRRDAFQNQIVRNARRLVIEDAAHYDTQRLNEIIEDLPHLDITIESLHSPADIFGLIQAWLSGDRPIGASCQIEVKNDEVARDVLKLVRTRYEKSKRTFRCVTIDQTNCTKVEVFYVPFTPPRSDKKKWMLRTRIVNV